MYGSFVRALRQSVGLSQQQLAEMVGTSQPTLSAYEHDRKVPSADTLNRIAVACGYQLTASAGERSVPCPLPLAGWFEDDNLPAADELDERLAEAERRGRMRHDAPRAERVAVVYEVLGLAESQRALAGRR